MCTNSCTFVEGFFFFFTVQKAISVGVCSVVFDEQVYFVVCGGGCPMMRPPALMVLSAAVLLVLCPVVLSMAG